MFVVQFPFGNHVLLTTASISAATNVTHPSCLYQVLCKKDIPATLRAKEVLPVPGLPWNTKCIAELMLLTMKPRLLLFSFRISVLANFINWSLSGLEPNKFFNLSFHRIEYGLLVD